MAESQAQERMTVKEAAEIMDVTPQFLRMGLRHDRFSFGTAVKMRRRWSYYINSRRFFLYLEGEDMTQAGKEGAVIEK